MTNIRIIFDIASMSIVLVGMVASLVILIRSYVRYPSLTANLPIFLTCNTYAVLLLNCLVMFEFYASTLYGELHPSVNLKNSWCFARCYLLCVCVSALLYSYTLQAMFRLLRVIFYQRKNLQSFRLFGFAVVGQWVLSILSILPQIMLKCAEYLPEEHNCQVSFKNISGFFTVMVCSYYAPLNIILLIYIAILRHTRRTNHTLQQHRRLANDRDRTVLRRILLLLLTLFVLAFPTLVIVMISWTTQYLPSFAYKVQELTLSFNLTTQVVVLTFLTPQMRALLRRSQGRVLPWKNTVVIPLAIAARTESL